MQIKRDAIRMGAKVRSKDGEGIVVGILHTDPQRYDILPLEGGRLRLYQTVKDHGVELIDNNPVDDPTIPAGLRDWVKNHRDRPRKKPIDTDRRVSINSGMINRHAIVVDREREDILGG